MIVETTIQRNYGTDHEYIVKPEGLAELWTAITGRKTITQFDKDCLHKLAVLFGAGLSTTNYPSRHRVGCRQFEIEKRNLSGHVCNGLSDDELLDDVLTRSGEYYDV